MERINECAFKSHQMQTSRNSARHGENSRRGSRLFQVEVIRVSGARVLASQLNTKL